MAVPEFQFTEPFGDARVEELKLLSWVLQAGTLAASAIPSSPWHDLVISLVWSNCLTAFSYDNATQWAVQKRRGQVQAGGSLVDSHGLPGDSSLERSTTIARLQAVEDLYRKEPVVLRLTHFGRVRLSELKQALRAGREREPFGILWDVRHWEQDLQIAILEAKEGSPVAVAYLDMNGLGQVNNTLGHDAGDLALRTYFQAVASALGDRGQAYRLSGGADEVLVVLPGLDEVAAVRLVRLACTKLMTERLWPSDPTLLLSMAAGVITSTEASASPTRLRASADEEQKRAKKRSKETAPRPSVIAVSGKEEMVVIPHDDTEAG